MLSGRGESAEQTAPEGALRSVAYLCVGAPDVALDLIHRVCAIGHSAQMQPLKRHFILGEGSCGRAATGSKCLQVAIIRTATPHRLNTPLRHPCYSRT